MAEAESLAMELALTDADEVSSGDMMHLEIMVEDAM